MSYDHQRLLHVLGADLLGALTTGQREETERACNQDEAGVARIARGVMAAPNVTAPAGLFLSKLRRDEHTAQQRHRSAAMERSAAAQLDFALCRYRARLAKYGDPSDALDYASEWTVLQHAGPLDAGQLEALMRRALGESVEPSEAAGDADVQRWARIAAIVNAAGKGSAIGQLLRHHAGPGVHVSSGRAVLLLAEAACRRDHADLWNASERAAVSGA